MQLAGGYAPTNTAPNKKLYNAGSEWQDDIDGLADYYSTFYREYDPVIGRFNGVDPMSASFESWTTYHYSYNNPVNFNDPMGDLPQIQTATTDRGRFFEMMLKGLAGGIPAGMGDYTVIYSGDDEQGNGGTSDVFIGEFDANSGGLLYLTADAAAAVWANHWEPVTRASGNEWSAMIYSKKKGEIGRAHV